MLSPIVSLIRQEFEVVRTTGVEPITFGFGETTVEIQFYYVDRNEVLRRMVAEVMEKTGLTKLAEIANALNLRGVKTNRGCEFTATQVHRLLN